MHHNGEVHTTSLVRLVNQQHFEQFFQPEAVSVTKPEHIPV